MKKRVLISVLMIVCVALSFSSCATGFYDWNSSLNSSETSDVSEINSEETVSSGSSENSESDEGNETEVSHESYSPIIGGMEGSQYSSLSELYSDCVESCVSIVCTVEVSQSTLWGSQTYEAQSLGSGFIISSEGTNQGFVVTNHHVVEDAKSIKVVFIDGEEVDATLVGSDSACDIAVLKISTERELKTVKIGDSDDVSVGEQVVAIGTPHSIEFAGTFTYGVVSGLNRKLDVTNDYGTVVKTMYLIQTDATLNPGNSGGALFNMNGQVIGINNMKLMDTYEGIGFSIPINGALDIINAILNGEDIPDTDYVASSAKLGVEVVSVTDSVRKSYNLDNNVPDGVLVVLVSRNTAVYEAGLEIYDIITEFNGVSVSTTAELQSELAKYSAGKEVTMKVYHPSRSGIEGEYVTLTFKLDKAS